jgi:hypothetical protein
MASFGNCSTTCYPARILEQADLRIQCQLLILLLQLHPGQPTFAGSAWDGKV